MTSTHPVPRHERVRRGNAGDAQRLRQALLDAALSLFVSGGLEAVSMRAVAARVGVSTMATYRYFANKAELLGGIWQFVLSGLLAHMQAAVLPARGARARQRAATDAFLAYWEANPSHYRLVYMAQASFQPDDVVAMDNSPVQAQLRQFSHQLIDQFAQEIGTDLRHVELAQDMHLAMQLGYLHALMAGRATRDMRTPYIDEMMTTMERVLSHGRTLN